MVEAKSLKEELWLRKPCSHMIWLLKWRTADCFIDNGMLFMFQLLVMENSPSSEILLCDLPSPGRGY